MASLPPCESRGPIVETARGLHYECGHPLVARPKRSVLVTAVACEECRYAAWSVSLAAAAYAPRRETSPTAAEYAARLATCDGCPERCGNACLAAGGSCGLTSKCARPSFVCPKGLFGKIQR